MTDASSLSAHAQKKPAPTAGTSTTTSTTDATAKSTPTSPTTTEPYSSRPSPRSTTHTPCSQQPTSTSTTEATPAPSAPSSSHSDTPSRTASTGKKQYSRFKKQISRNKNSRISKVEQHRKKTRTLGEERTFYYRSRSCKRYNHSVQRGRQDRRQRFESKYRSFKQSYTKIPNRPNKCPTIRNRTSQ